MKYILSLIIGGALVVSGFGQTRNVLVGTNNAVVQPTNFWSADASNARTGLGLGTAATNPATAFQPSSLILSNLASSNGAGLTNIAVSGVVGALATNGNAIGLTNFPANLLTTNGNGAGLTNLTAANITGTVALASNLSSPLTLTNGGTGATNAADARQNIGLGLTNSAFSVLSVGTNNTNLSDDNSSVFGSQNFVDSTANESFAFGSANKITNMPAGAGGSIVMGILGNMTNQGAFLFNGVPQGGTVGNSRGNNTFAVNATNGIYLNGSVYLEQFALGGGGANSPIMVSIGNGAISRFGTNISTAVPAFLGWSGFEWTSFSAGIARTNMGLPWSGLTNTNAATFQTALFGANTNPVLVNTNGEVVSPTNFWQAAPITTIFVESQPSTNSTTNITAARFLHIHSLNTNIVNVTNTIALPTNGSTYNGDVALIVHQGPTNSMTRVRAVGSTNDIATMTRYNEAIEFVYYNNGWTFNHNEAFTEPIYFAGTNAAGHAAESRTNLGLGVTQTVQFNQVDAQIFFVDEGAITFSGTAAATTRTNLGFGATNVVEFSDLTFSNQTISGGGLEISYEDGTVAGVNFSFQGTNVPSYDAAGASNTRVNLGIPLAALTNTNNANFQAAVFNTNAAPTPSVNFGDAVAWLEITVQTNGTNASFRIPLYEP